MIELLVQILICDEMAAYRMKSVFVKKIALQLKN